MTGVLQLSEILRPGNRLAMEIFTDVDRATTMFPGSSIQNSQWSEHKRKNFNVCSLGKVDTEAEKMQVELRRKFFYENWL
jgi:hypothetical protein